MTALKPAARLGDATAIGLPIASGTPTVFVNTIPAALPGNSSSVFVHNIPAGRMGDVINHASPTVSGSADVYIGG